MAKAKPTTQPPGEKPPRKRRARRGAENPALPERSDDANAFIPDPGEGPARTKDDLAELLAEDFVESATRGNEVLEDDLDQPLSDEVGGPFVVTRARDEFAEGTDESNPEDAEAEPLPKPVAGLVQRPRAEALDEEDEDEEEESARDDDEDDDGDRVRAEGDLAEEEEEEDEDGDEDEDEDEDEEKLAADALEDEEPVDDEEDPEELDDGTRRRTH